MLQPTFEFKDAFVDSQKVINAVDRATRRALTKSLAFVRTRARTSVLRRRRESSSPGNPPSIHSSDSVATLRNILFAYDERTKSGVVGPVKLNQVNLTSTGSLTVPQILEGGASVGIREEQWKNSPTGRWFRRDNRMRSNPGKRYRVRTATYRARPFMGPSLQIEADKGNIASPWANVVTQ
jgi:hypothetical protein